MPTHPTPKPKPTADTLRAFLCNHGYKAEDIPAGADPTQLYHVAMLHGYRGQRPAGFRYHWHKRRSP